MGVTIQISMSDGKHDNESWRLLRIISEFVDGFESMQNLGPAVAFFGSAKVCENDSYYLLAKELGKLIGQLGIAVVTGGGPGIMKAANEGCRQAGAPSCGVSIKLPYEEEINPYVDFNYSIKVSYYFVRKVLLVRYALAYVVFPGGFGTLDEFFEIMTLIQTKKVEPVPIFLIGKTFWEKMISWLKESPLCESFIKDSDLNLFQVTDDLEWVASQISKQHKETHRSFNFK